LFIVGYLSEVVGVRLADGREVVVKRRADESGRTRICLAGQRLLAVLLADLTDRLTTFDLDPPVPNPEWVRWESLPDQKSASEAPTWIEDTSRRVRAKLAGCRLPSILGHADWEAQNIRWLRGEPLVVHDWDSLAWLPEAVLVGAAAGVFASHDTPTLAPVESSAAFLDAYQRARGEGFSPDEHEVAWAATILVALNNVRDELMFDHPRLSYDG
jgi:hypothetical protein